MIDFLEKIDQDLLLFINGMHSPIFDTLMWWISLSTIWIPLYAFLIYKLIQKYKKQFWKILIVIVACVALTDGISSGIIKPLVGRYRPSHNLDIKDQLNLHHYPDGTFYAGGTYGFVSSHAANSFGVAVLIILLLGCTSKHYYWLILWASVISYSRMYLGVHYPSDIVGGLCVGIFSAYLSVMLGKYFLKFNLNQSISKHE